MSKIIAAHKLLMNNPKKIFITLGRNGLLGFIPDKIYLKIAFKLETGYNINFKHPRTYNEKLNWLKLYDRKEEYKNYADKYLVRNVVKDRIGETYLIPLIDVFDSYKEINFDNLPNRFVIKSSNGSGGTTNIICRNKNEINIKDTLKIIRSWSKIKTYKGGREWCYKGIKHRIIVEKLLENDNGVIPDDYKFMCFNGEPKLIQHHHDRYGNHTLNYYYPDWTPSNLKRVDVKKSDQIVEKPKNLSKMIQIARELSKNMYFARIDLYNINGKIYFGEITMYPTSGFSSFDSYEDDLILGSWLKLPCDTK